jgi:hypothetical protein
MSEKIYAWLLRLYPLGFREAYGEAAMQLFRDRFRYERGFLPALRLWLDLLADLAASLPGQHLEAALAASAPPLLEGAPSFSIVESRPPRFGALFLGGVLSLFGAAASIPVFNLSTAPRYLAFTLNDTQSPAPSASDSSDAAPQSAAETSTLDAAERGRVIQAVAANLKEHYPDPTVARNVAEALLAHQIAGDYQAVVDPAAFAALLTTQARELSHDVRLGVVYTKAASRSAPPPMQSRGCGFEKVSRLAHKIGYLKLDFFPDSAVCRPEAASAMAFVNGADALIFDLRDNSGGYPGMVMFVASYLFDHPEYMYNPREPTTERSWTNSPVPGSKLADKPVYVLTSARTFSGAEHFSYDLKMLRRATIVGETTAGATDTGVFYRVGDRFGIGMPQAGAINPFSKNDWAGIGVEPDVKVKAADALVTAEALAQKKLRLTDLR